MFGKFCRLSFFAIAGTLLMQNVAYSQKIMITSTPPLNATVNTLYTYQVTAVSPSNAVLSFHLGVHPPAMTIDSATGLISWMPQARGWRSVEIVVTSSTDRPGRQEFLIRVGSIDGTISGTVTDTLGNPLAHVVIHLYQSGIRIPATSLVLYIGPFFDYEAQTDSAGKYSISHVDEGNYFVQAVPLNPNYLPEWYNNVSDIKNATALSVTDSDSVYTAANFKLENRFYRLPKFTISGVVTDTLGNPAKSAWVVFARAGFVFNDARYNQSDWTTDVDYREFFDAAILDKGLSHDFRLDGTSPFVYKTYVDSSGVYQDTLPEGNYVVFAKAHGYYRAFLSNQSSLLSSGILSLTGDTANIDFKLISIPPVVIGQIAGSVFDSTTGVGVPARMIAFRDIWDYRDTLKMHVAGAYFADADSTGAYEFVSLPPGYYKILALPLGSYAPSFYSLNGSTVRWRQATAVQIDGDSVSGVNVYVMQLPDSATGYVSINGTVKSSSTHSGVSGAMVYSADANGNILGYGITDGSGSYTIAGLAPGTFNAFPDAVGYTSTGSNSSSPAYVSGGSAAPFTTNFSVSPETPTSVNPPTARPTTYSLEQNYPNPFNPTTQIAFNLAQTEHIAINVFNILGQKVATIADGEMSSGAHVVMWDGRNQHGEVMPSGVYFYKLSTPNFTAVKKMVLLK